MKTRAGFSGVMLTGSLLLAVPAAPAAAQESPVLLEGAKVFTGRGEFDDNLQILIQGGKILAIGKQVPVPATDDLERLDLSGKWLTPGLVDGNTSLGLPSAHENEESSEITPHLRVLDAVDPASPDFRRAVRDGVTTAYISPGGKNVFGGLGAVCKTAGSARLLRERCGVRMTLGLMPSSGNRSFRTRGSPTSIYYRRPTARMGTIWEIRKAFYDAMDRRETRIGPTVEPSAATQVLIDALDRKIDVRTMARSDQDIRTAVRLAEEFGIKIVLDGAQEAYYALDYIVAAKMPVIAAPPSLATAADGATPHLDTLALLSGAGVPVAIQTGQATGSAAALPLIREATFAVRGGMSRRAALEAVTSVPATLLGVADRIGSLEKGKDADVVIWSRHPLHPSSRAERIYVDGIDVTDTDK